MASIQRTDYGVAYKKALRDAHDLNGENVVMVTINWCAKGK